MPSEYKTPDTRFQRKSTPPCCPADTPPVPATSERVSERCRPAPFDAAAGVCCKAAQAAETSYGHDRTPRAADKAVDDTDRALGRCAKTL
eukprot:2504306-Rhodomonas_salina.3